MQELREVVTRTCAYRNCENEFIPTDNRQRFCCPKYRQLEGWQSYRDRNPIKGQVTMNPEHTVYDRPFTADTDMMIVADDLNGKSLIKLAFVLRRSAKSVLSRLAELKTSDKYDGIAFGIRRQQRYGAEEYGRGKTGLPFIPYGADGY